MRHVSRTHRVHLDWLYERFLHDPHFRIRYVQTKYQIADILTKGQFTKEKWKELLHLCSMTPIMSQKQTNKSTHAHGLCSRSSQLRLVSTTLRKGNFVSWVQSRIASSSRAMPSAMYARSLDAENTTMSVEPIFKPNEYAAEKLHQWEVFEVFHGKVRRYFRRDHLGAISAQKKLTHDKDLRDYIHGLHPDYDNRT